MFYCSVKGLRGTLENLILNNSVMLHIFATSIALAQSTQGINVAQQEYKISYDQREILRQVILKT